MANLRGIFYGLFMTSLIACSDDVDHTQTLMQGCFNHYRAESYLAATRICEQATDTHVKAQWFLGHIYYYDLANQNTSKEQGFTWYLKAAENDWLEAQTFVGESYMQGEGVKTDYAKAYYWLNKAAKSKDYNAEFSIGMLFFNGNGRDKDVSAAISWFKKAANQQHEMSINNLTWIYATSEEKNYRNAKKSAYWSEKMNLNVSSNQYIFLDTKAAVYAILGQFEDAVAMQKKAIALLPENSNESRIKEYQQHLIAYQNKQSWQE